MGLELVTKMKMSIKMWGTFHKREQSLNHTGVPTQANLQTLQAQGTVSALLENNYFDSDNDKN